jgi:uncharacterized RDD family membrane protein YckC
MTTQWYYASEDRQMGPIPESALDSLVSTGVIEPYTLVWHEGMGGWQPYSSLRNGVSVQPSNPSDEVPGVVGLCSQCEEAQLHSEMVRFGADWVCANCKDKYTQRLREGTLGRGMVYAGFGARVGAWLIDSLILGMFQLFVLVMYGAAGSSFTPSVLLRPGLGFQVFQFFVSAGYYIFFVYRSGGTPGKLIVGCRIVTASDENLTLARSTGRYFASVISATVLCLGYVMAFFDDERRTLHDRICDTRVILKSERFV